jgi:hypothetical protein
MSSPISYGDSYVKYSIPNHSFTFYEDIVIYINERYTAFYDKNFVYYVYRNAMSRRVNILESSEVFNVTSEEFTFDFQRKELYTNEYIVSYNRIIKL